MTASLPTRIGIVLGVVAALLFGLWVASGLLAPTYLTSIAFGVGWFVLASVGLGKAVKKRPDLRWWVRGTFLATAAVVAAGFAWTSLRDETVNEDVAGGGPGPAAGGPAGSAGTSLRDETVNEDVAVGVPVTAAAGPPVEAGKKHSKPVAEK